VEELEVQRADLEDVFLQVMHGQNNTVGNAAGAQA
jgi:hypothetical protein